VSVEAFISNPLGFMSRQLPSANENRGDLRLEDAHRIALDYESVIDPKDRETIRNTITHAREMIGLNAKWGVPKFLQAREYRRAAAKIRQYRIGQGAITVRESSCQL